MSRSLDAPPWLAARDWQQTVAGPADWGARVGPVLEHLSNYSGVNPSTDDEFEDLIAHFFWRRVGGLVLEMGGLDGVLYSESLRLERLFGWRRILIEGDPDWRPKRRKVAPEAAGLALAVCESPRTVHFIAGHNPALSGIAEFWKPVYMRRFHSEILKLRNRAKNDWSKVEWRRLKHHRVSEVQCLPLGMALEALGVTALDVLILDTEGSELAILSTVDFARLNVSVLVVETEEQYRCLGYTQKVIDLVLRSGQFRVWQARRGRNTWFVNVHFAPSGMEAGALRRHNESYCAHRDCGPLLQGRSRGRAEKCPQ